MADADLDVIIRQVAKQQNKTLMAAVKKRRDRYIALAQKAKDGDAKQQLRQMAKHAMEEGTAAAKRLQMSADNAADSYARAIRKAAEVLAAQAATAEAKKAAAKKAPAKKSAKAAKPAKAGKTAKAAKA
ncbi:MAG TPA: hypothetical protein VGM35_05315 [Xanthobacteraceae bacterium]|jgi:hypothetical protein